MKELPKPFVDATIRASLEHSSTTPLINVFPSFGIIENEEEHEEISVQLKKSDDTAAEPFEKKSSGMELEDLFFL